jgi:hypothetical protein
VVFDIDKGEYRTINMDKLIYLRYNGKEVVGSQAMMDALN